jgi:predicted RNase H-like nuclease (RuvC/YqgF family)
MSITNIAGAVSPATTPKAKEINDTSSLDRKIEQLKKQLEQVKENKEISQEEKNKRITNIEKHIAQLEQQKGQESRNTSSNDIKKRVDTYEAQPPQQSAGVYQVTHDENGRRIIQVDESCETAQGQPKAKPQDESEKPNIVKTTVNTDKVDKEIEKLKQTQTQLEQKIAAAKEPKEKEKLEAQLAQVNAELKAKDNDTYRQHHMEITEQKVVSKVGE